MNIEREVKILSATGIEGIVERFEKQVKYWRKYILLAYFGFGFIFLATISKNFLVVWSKTLLFLGILFFLLYLLYILVVFKMAKEINYSWHLFSPHLFLHSFFGLSIFVGAGIPITMFLMLYTSKYGNAMFPDTKSFMFFVLIFVLIGFIPIFLIGVELIIAKNKSLSILKIFKGPYIIENIEKITQALNKRCRKIEELKSIKSPKFNCYGFMIRSTHNRHFNLKDYNILIEIQNIDENNAPYVKEVVEKIEEILKSKPPEA